MSAENKVIVIDVAAFQREKAATKASIGRPRKYTRPMRKITIQVPDYLKQAGRRKARRAGVNTTELLQYAYLDFVTRPIEETIRRLDEYRAKYGVMQ